MSPPYGERFGAGGRGHGCLDSFIGGTARPASRRYCVRKVWQGLVVGSFAGAAVGFLVDSGKRSAELAAEAAANLRAAAKEHAPQAAAAVRSAAAQAGHAVKEADLPGKAKVAAQAVKDADIPGKVGAAAHRAADSDAVKSASESISHAAHAVADTVSDKVG
jgi:hypothetical protein